ncbi:MULTISPECIES: efflux transporter outer membrane subunit [Ramlibacter]|uniref:Efflux transporter outer membrane subunit n=1 Tax=Ramlibacter pinisoli TaxID=2682844 RepID=A0A6N8IQY6_9BURK|nr:MULTISPECIES: efflux transporter outer membrane subunit [Ramlibacter]MBA2963581.1 efflux transporter outer membrane subunit [Ramlibacter sp. CGMCC 1.13660]MVQ28546.1 efflux transporter outer membrane subunit [Ramlibacter pinisoli]
MTTAKVPGRWAATMAAVLLAGCASTGGIEPQARLRRPESLGLPAATATAVPAPVAPQWWAGFGDTQLDRLVAQALADNPNLKVAQARLARAQSVLEGAHAATQPQVDASLDLKRQLFTENGLFPPPLAGSVRNTGTLQLGASWELDFFGKYSQALEAALGASRAAQADVGAAHTLLAAQVARGYFQLERLNDQLDVARRTLAQREEFLRLVRDRVRAGLDTTLEERQGEAAIPDARQQIEALEEQVQLTRNALAALVGQPQLQLEPRLLADARPVPLPATIPADLLARRADITAARWRVEAASHDVESAKASFYPNVNLSAFVGLSSVGLGRLVDMGSQQWGVGPAVHLPIFDAGRLRANLGGRTADLDLAVESYNGAVLDAVRDVADQLASAQSIERQQAQQREGQVAAEGAYDIALQRYRAGLGTYLNVLSAETAVLAQRRLAVDLAARALDTQVQLMRALGGGFQPDPESLRLASQK